MALVDQYGTPIKRADLTRQIAQPTLAGVRSATWEPVTTGLDPAKLATMLRAADDGDMEAYLSMAEEIEEKDAHYLSVIGTRKRAVAQLEITVEAASDDKVDVENAALIERWLARDTLEDEIFDILDAIGKGFSVMEIMWELGTEEWMPSRLVYRDPRWFEFDRETRQQLMLRGHGMPEALPPFKFIVHKGKAKSGLPVRGGIIRPCAWMYLFKNFSVKDWVIFAEAYGQPIRVGKYHAGASEDEKNILLKAVAKIGSDAAAIIPESMVIEFIEAQQKATTAEVFEKLIRLCDAQISKAVLGQTMTTDDGSSKAQAVVHNDVRGDIERADAKQLAATLNEQLVKPIVMLNKGPQKRYPKIQIGRAEDVDVEAIMNAADKAVRMGMRVSEKGLREKVGLPEPESDEDILRPLASAAPAEAPIEEDQAASIQTAAAQPQKDDAIGSFADQMAGEWEDIMDPLMTVLRKAATEAETYEEFNQKLLELVDDLKIDGLAERVRNANFMAALAGQLNAKLEE